MFYLSVVIIPFQMNADVLFCVVVNFEGVFFSHCLYKMFRVLFLMIFDATIYTEPSQKGTKQEEQNIQNYYLIFGDR